MSVGQRLYKRRWEVAIGKPGERGRLWNNIDINFKISKSDKKRPNQLELQIYNLSKDSRAWIERDNSVVILRVGYDDSDPSTIFIGDISDVAHERDGEDILTTINAGDGQKSFALSDIQETFSAGVTNKQILARAIEKMGCGVGFLADIEEVQYPQGFTASGSVESILDEVVGSVGSTWSLQDGTLQVVNEDKGTNQTVTILRSDTGLVGTPKRKKSSKKSSQKKAGVSAVSLMNPLLKPGSYVRIESEFITGFFLVKTVEHNGDSYGDDWYTTFDATDIQATPELEAQLNIQPGVLTETDWWTRLMEEN